jgi:uncharacterized protein (TIGR02246 family)
VDDHREIWSLIDRCNSAWTCGRPREVDTLYAEDAILVAPGLEDTIRGRAAIVETYLQFVSAATVERFDTVQRSLHVVDDVAVAAYVFEITYTMDDAARDECGEEILVLRRHKSGWKVSWRTQVSFGPATRADPVRPS